MPLSFQSIREDAFLGIDARSAENQVPPGYQRDLVNGDIIQGRAKTRQGYAGYAGNFPVRPVSAEYHYISAANPLNKICFTLDNSVEAALIDLINVRSSPIVVYGRTSRSMGAGPFSTTDAAKYYSGFTQDIRSAWDLGTNQNLVIPGSQHGLGTADLFVNVAESLSPVTLDNQLIEYNSLTVDESSFDLTLNYDNSDAAKTVFVYYSDQSPAVGTTYKTANQTITNGSTGTFTISAATHQLANYNVIARCYQDLGTTRQLVQPTSLTVNPTTGEVIASITNNSGASGDFLVILSAAPAANFKQGAYSGGTYTITISNPDKPFIFPGVYVTNGTVLEQVIPDEVVYNSSTATIAVTFQTPISTNAFTFYWEYATIRSTEFCVYESTIDTSGTDTLPQITVWGLDQTEIYGSARTEREGWANHVDSYRVAGESRVIAGHGGNLYAVREYSESGTSYLYGSAYPDLFNRTASSAVIAPSFWGTGETPGRTRGYVTGTGLDDNWATCTAVSWDGAVAGGSVRYDLTIPALLINDSANATITTNDTNINLVFTVGDQLTANNMSYSVHNGTFSITQVTASGTNISIWVTNSSVTGADWDDSGCGGNVGVFTDRLSLQADSPFIPGDRLLSAAFGDSLLIDVVSSSETTPTQITISGISALIAIQAGVRLTGQRTGYVMPVRNFTDTSTAVNFVRGDIVFYSGESDRPLRLVTVNALENLSCSIVSAATVATVTLGSGTTDHLSIGMRVLITRAGVLDGEQVITDVLNQTQFTFDSSYTYTASAAVLRGNTLQLGESIEWSDSIGSTNTIQVDRRILPVEAPDDSYSLTPATRTHYFDFRGLADQRFLRSVMVQDNMYLTNGEDEVMKLDGTSLYRAGLPNWQPGVFIQSDAAATSKIVLDVRSFPFKSATTNAEIAAGKTQIDGAYLDSLPVGTSVKVIQGAITLSRVIQGYSTDSTGSTHYVVFTKALTGFTTGTAGTVGEAATFKYYYRLNAVDQNQNVIASAVSQSDDYSIELTQDAAIYHKLIGFPAWDNYDYDQLYLQVYRTKAGTSAPYYRVYQQRIPFNGADGYIEFTDSFSDSNLFDLDPVSTALKGQELGIGWQEPLRAKSITSAANTVVLGNIRDYPELDVQFFGDSTVTAAQLNGTKLTLRRDFTDTTTLTNMVDRATYQFVDGTSTQTITGITGVASTSFTVTTSAAHGLAAGNWVYIYWNTASTPASSNRPITYSGWWQVFSAPTGSTFTVKYTGAIAGAAANFPTRLVTATTKTDIPVFLGDPITAPDGNSSASTQNSTLQLYHAGRRLALAINASMRMTDVSLAAPDQTSFKPWVMARGGNDTGVSGRILLRQPRTDTDTFGIKLTNISSSAFNLFVNGVQRSASETIPASVALFPSRILIGYENYGEIFDNPTATLDTESDSAVDVNPADGQEISGIAPFFGDAAFGAAQQSAVIVVFKENSIYLVDANEKRAGRNAVQRIETEGVGCTAPNSISVTKNGIMFANESGMYVLRRNLSVEYIGLKMERQWERLDHTQLELAQGHHYNLGRKYKLSVPISGDNGTNEVFVYDHTNEQQQLPGTWSRYTNHPVTGWCNLGEEAYFCSSTGRLFQIRHTGQTHDFQDDHDSISFLLQTRANDFGMWGIRKMVRAIIVNYRTAIPSVASVGVAVDTELEYTGVTGARIVSPGTNLSGVSDINGRDVLTVMHNTHKQKGVSMSVQITNDTRLEAVEIAGIEFSVATFGNGGGVLQAANTNP